MNLHQKLHSYVLRCFESLPLSNQLLENTTDDEDSERGRRRGGEYSYSGGGSEDSDSGAEMEYCDPCYCYGKCCLDVVASIFCLSIL